MKFTITCPLCKAKHISEQKNNIIYCCNLNITHYFNVRSNYWIVLISGENIDDRIDFISLIYKSKPYKTILDYKSSPEDLINYYIRFVENLIFE